MEQFVIKGGKPLQGHVTIGGAKNAALAILAASLMTDDDVVIDNLPDVRDINVMLDAMGEIGAKVERIDRHTARINGRNVESLSVDYEYIKKIRASYYLLGALLGKYKKAEVALPGGCAIGARPIDLHVKGFKALGADIDIGYGLISAKAKWLAGNHIYLDKVSVGATINILMAATLADGKTVIENAAKEPHVVDVANFLNSMGANIRGAGTDVIRIVGVPALHGTEYSVIPDQIGGSGDAWYCDSAQCDSAPLGSDDSKIAGSRVRNHRVRRRRAGKCGEPLVAAHAGDDIALSGFPHRYAAADDGRTRAVRGDKYRDREHI